MTPTLQAAASGNLAAFEGAQLEGTIPVRESFLIPPFQEAIAKRRGRVKEIDLRIGADNLLQFGVRVAVGPFTKWFRPQMIIRPQLMTPHGPTLVLTIASSEYLGLMWIAQVFASEFFPRGVAIDGRQISVDLAAMIPAGPARNLLPYLRNLTARTVPGVILIGFELKVEHP